jgi:hypothetical protein
MEKQNNQSLKCSRWTKQQNAEDRRLSEGEDRTSVTTQSEHQRENRLDKNHPREPQGPVGYVKRSNTHIDRVPEREQGWESILKK